MTSISPAPIVLDDPNRPVDQSVLDTPGGFVWWYADSIDEHGDGLVLIWSFGLPFLPGLLSRARAGDPAVPRRHAALNVVWYRGGREAFYLLQTYPDAEWTGGSFRFGRSRISITRRGPVHRVDAELDCDVPRSGHRLKGVVRLAGPAAVANEPRAPTLEHAWTPLIGPGVLRARLEHGPNRFEHFGRAYHDRNVGHGPLDQLGIGRWSWGRTVRAERTRAHYVVWNDDGALDTAWLVDVGRDGGIDVRRDATVDATNVRRSRYGVPHQPDLALRCPDGTTVARQDRAVVDDGPFYLRTLFTEDDGAVGIAEHVVPRRIDLARHRPLVRMRVHDTRGPTSWWLPLFSGPDRGRWARLFGLEGSS